MSDDDKEDDSTEDDSTDDEKIDRVSEWPHYLDLQALSISFLNDYETNRVRSTDHWNAIICNLNSAFIFGWRSSFNPYLCLNAETNRGKFNLVNMNIDTIHCKYGKKTDDNLYYALDSKLKKIYLSYFNSNMSKRTPTNAPIQYLLHTDHGVPYGFNKKQAKNCNVSYKKECKKKGFNERLNLYRHYGNLDIAPYANATYRTSLIASLDHTKKINKSSYEQFRKVSEYVLLLDCDFNFNQPPIKHIHSETPGWNVLSFDEGIQLLKRECKFKDDDLVLFKNNMEYYGWDEPDTWIDLAKQRDVLTNEIEMKSGHVHRFKKFVDEYKNEDINIDVWDVPLRMCIGGVWLQVSTANIINPMVLNGQKVPIQLNCSECDDGVLYGKQVGYRIFDQNQINLLEDDKFEFLVEAFKKKEQSISFGDPVKCDKCSQNLDSFESVFMHCNSCYCVICKNCIDTPEELIVRTSNDDLFCMFGCGKYLEPSFLKYHYIMLHPPIQLEFRGQCLAIDEVQMTEWDWNDRIFKRYGIHKCTHPNCDRIFLHAVAKSNHVKLAHPGTCCTGKYCLTTRPDIKTLRKHQSSCPLFQHFAVNNLHLRGLDSAAQRHIANVIFDTNWTPYLHDLEKIYVKNNDDDIEYGILSIDDIFELITSYYVTETLPLVWMAHLVPTTNWSHPKLINVFPDMGKRIRDKKWKEVLILSLSGAIDHDDVS